jgi:hypothetical protein
VSFGWRVSRKAALPIFEAKSFTVFLGGKLASRVEREAEPHRVSIT